MVHLNVAGEAFVAKYRAESEIVQLGLLDPRSVDVELRGQRIVYTLLDRRVEVGPSDVLHIKGMSADGLRGLSPVAACRAALQLSAGLQAEATASTHNGSRPSGVLNVAAPQSDDTIEQIRERWDQRHGGVEAAGRVAVVQGDVKFEAVSFSAEDSQFLQQRELSAREVARIFRVPAWVIDAPTGDSLTYSNVTEQARAFVTFSLRPWLVRIERAISGDPDLCPGSTYCRLRPGRPAARGRLRPRGDLHSAALDPATGWMRRDEVRRLEDLPPRRPDRRCPLVPDRPTAGQLEDRALPAGS